LRSGNQVRITAQLIHASADKHIWAQSYEGEIRGTLVLQNLARAGADLAAWLRFMPPSTPEKEMRDANVDWQLISYGNTVHSFTNWDLDSDHSKPAACNAKSEARSWAAMRTFFEEISPTGTPGYLDQIFYSRSQCRYSDLIGAFPTASVAVFLPKGRSRPRSASTGGAVTSRTVRSPSGCKIMPLFALIRSPPVCQRSASLIMGAILLSQCIETPAGA
jgi:hypothetical protein